MAACALGSDNEMGMAGPMGSAGSGGATKFDKAAAMAAGRKWGNIVQVSISFSFIMFMNIKANGCIRLTFVRHGLTHGVKYCTVSSHEDIAKFPNWIKCKPMKIWYFRWKNILLFL